MKTQAQPSLRRQIWSRIALLTVVFVPILALVSLTLTPAVFGFSGPTAMSDGMFTTGLIGLLVGLVGLGMAPRRRRNVYLDKVGRFRSPTINGGTIGMSILFAAIVLIALAAVVSST